jgi:hypothetical protein
MLIGVFLTRYSSIIYIYIVRGSNEEENDAENSEEQASDDAAAKEP